MAISGYLRAGFLALVWKTSQAFPDMGGVSCAIEVSKALSAYKACVKGEGEDVCVACANDMKRAVSPQCQENADVSKMFEKIDDTERCKSFKRKEACIQTSQSARKELKTCTTSPDTVSCDGCVTDFERNMADCSKIQGFDVWTSKTKDSAAKTCAGLNKAQGLAQQAQGALDGGLGSDDSSLEAKAEAALADAQASVATTVGEAGDSMNTKAADLEAEEQSFFTSIVAGAKDVTSGASGALNSAKESAATTIADQADTIQECSSKASSATAVLASCVTKSGVNEQAECACKAAFDESVKDCKDNDAIKSATASAMSMYKGMEFCGDEAKVEDLTACGGKVTVALGIFESCSRDVNKVCACAADFNSSVAICLAQEEAETKFDDARAAVMEKASKCEAAETKDMFGKLPLSVSDATAFLKNAQSSAAVEAAIAQIAGGIDPKYVAVILEKAQTIAGMRRLGASDFVANVLAKFSVSIPGQASELVAKIPNMVKYLSDATPEKTTAALTGAVKDHLGGGFTVSGRALELTPSVEVENILKATTPSPAEVDEKSSSSWPWWLWTLLIGALLCCCGLSVWAIMSLGSAKKVPSKKKRGVKAMKPVEVPQMQPIQTAQPIQTTQPVNTMTAPPMYQPVAPASTYQVMASPGVQSVAMPMPAYAAPATHTVPVPTYQPVMVQTGMMPQASIQTAHFGSVNAY